MRNKTLFSSLAAVALVAGLSLITLAEAAACSVANCRESGGARWTIGSGGSLDVLSSGELDIEGA